LDGYLASSKTREHCIRYQNKLFFSSFDNRGYLDRNWVFEFWEPWLSNPKDRHGTKHGLGGVFNNCPTCRRLMLNLSWDVFANDATLKKNWQWKPLFVVNLGKKLLWWCCITNIDKHNFFGVIIRVGQAWRIVVGINNGTKVHMMYFNRYILPMLGG
jgi:hypothetical protein